MFTWVEGVIDLLAVRGLKATYGEGMVLHGVDLFAEEGKITCLVGRNGVGKSTTLRSIMGLVKTSGSIQLDGEELNHLQTCNRVHRGIGYVPQGREIFPQLTVEENLLLGLEAAGGKGRIGDEVFQLFPVLKDFLHRKGGDLSGGQQQQLAIARALVARPKILVLDEPTEGIQPSIIQEIGRIIRMLCKSNGMTVLIVEQYVEFVFGISDYFYVMDKGRIIMEGEVDSAELGMVQSKISI